MKKIIFLSAVTLTVIIASCKKPAGEGGRATIKGRIWVENYNTLGPYPGGSYTLKGEFAGADEDVYIIYGDDVSYGNKVKSGPDGIFEFKYLRKGDYKIYVESKDTTRASYFYGSGIKTVDVSVTISDKKEVVETEDLVIYK
ncbi:MAG: hypothetical protein SGJ15_09595 [Bacteroidota bacterium]|nr:hypothetical protein [Bacteroidota bacterium]